MRELDIIVVGATGYTGRLCTKYFATKLPRTLRWAIAGRSKSKLEKLVGDLDSAQTASEPGIIQVDVLSRDEVDELVKRCTVMVSVVGPYDLVGSEVFRACARNGTHYLDCNGEGPWLKDMIIENDAIAKESAAIMMPMCGTIGIPAEVSATLLSQHFEKSFNTKLFGCQTCIEKILPESPSGGSMATLYNVITKYGLDEMAKAGNPFAMSPVKPAYLTGISQPGAPTKAQVVHDAETYFGKMNAFGIQPSPLFGPVTISPLDGADCASVTRAWGILSTTPHAYSSNFYYAGTRQVAKSVVQGWISRAVFKFALFLLASWVGRYLMRSMPQQGDGASEELMSQGLVELTVVGAGEKVEGKEGRPMATCKWRYPKDGYTFTAVMLGQAAMILLGGGTKAHQLGGGILCVSLLGDEFVERLRGAGATIQVKTIT